MEHEMTEEYDKEDRVIPEDQERAYRLVAGEFGGQSVSQAAATMRITRTQISRLLAKLKATAPQLFPLITKNEFAVLAYLQNGVGTAEIANYLGFTTRKVQRCVESLIKKGRWTTGIPKTVRYTEQHDSQIKEKF
jgi:DNA-binding transcriptional regulator LsrR (DeoR family)